MPIVLFDPEDGILLLVCFWEFSDWFKGYEGLFLSNFKTTSSRLNNEKKKNHCYKERLWKKEK